MNCFPITPMFTDRIGEYVVIPAHKRGGLRRDSGWKERVERSALLLQYCQNRIKKKYVRQGISKLDQEAD